MKFIIQVNNQNQIIHDFSFTLLNAIKYHEWKQRGIQKDMVYETFIYDGITVPSQKHGKYVPIGTVEFVLSCLETLYGLKPKPKNVPVELFKLAGRNIKNGTKQDAIKGKFIKSNDSIKKGFTGVYNGEKLTKGNYQISDFIDIVSEYRVFVYQNKMVGIKHYVGDFTIFPNINIIEDMILSYKTQPVAFTLDIAITDKGKTVPIEVHDFFSCGLYGFNRLDILPYMFSNWFYEYTNLGA